MNCARSGLNRFDIDSDCVREKGTVKTCPWINSIITTVFQLDVCVCVCVCVGVCVCIYVGYS